MNAGSRKKARIAHVDAVTFDFHDRLVYPRAGRGRGARLMEYLQSQGLPSDPWEHQGRCTVMPHLTLEHTTNLLASMPLEELFARLHAILHDIGGIRRENCKSRAVERERFYVGDGAPGGGFVHLDVRFLEGRSLELKQEIGLEMLALLRECYGTDGDTAVVQFTVEIRDITRATYFKFPADSLDY